jgi:hypothetical protein
MYTVQVWAMFGFPGLEALCELVVIGNGVDLVLLFRVKRAWSSKSPTQEDTHCSPTLSW